MRRPWDLRMASSDFWQRLSGSLHSGRGWDTAGGNETVRGGRGARAVWMASDGVTILAAATAATFYRLHTLSLAEAHNFWAGKVFPHHPLSMPIALLFGFTLAVIISSRRMRLYEPLRLNDFFR